MKRRYRALRAIGCDPIVAGLIALLNWLRGYPDNEVRFMHMSIEIEDSP